jgi:hypothetical protein
MVTCSLDGVTSSRGPVVFDKEASDHISQAYRIGETRVGHRAFYDLQKDKFLFQVIGTNGRPKWVGFEGFFYSGLGETIVYTIGEGGWEWEEVSGP